MTARVLSVCASALLAASLACPGCSGPIYVALDATVLDADAPRELTLVLLSAASLAIRPGELATIEVRCVDLDGDPRPDVDLRFAIEGTGLDSTLRTLSMRSDADGRASADLLAGTRATTFRVRISSSGAAAAVYVNVGVGTSFGTLVVRVPYAGHRLVTRRVVDVVPHARCAELLASPPEVGARAVPEGLDEIRVAGLPTTVRYAVLARASSDLVLTATGCVDDVEVPIDGATPVDVPFVDAPLSFDGAYSLTAEIDAEASTDIAFGIMTAELQTASDRRGGDASAILDLVASDLAARVSMTARDELVAARAAEELDPALAAAMYADRSAPTVVALRWIDAARIAMAQPRLDGRLVVSALGASVVTTDLVSIPDAADGSLSFSLSTLAPTLGLARSVVLLADRTRDALRVAALTFEVPLGAMMLAWLDAIARSDGLAGLEGLVAPACATLRAFVAERASTAVCDGECAESVCTAAIAQTVDDLQVAAAVLDAMASDLSFEGELEAVDAAGDLRVDHVAGTLSGTRPSASGGDLGSATGTFELLRVSP